MMGGVSGVVGGARTGVGLRGGGEASRPYTENVIGVFCDVMNEVFH